MAEIARSIGVDAISAHEIGRRGLRDEEQLRLASEEGRCLVTRNRDDFLRLTVEFFEARRLHAGVLIVSYSLSRAGPESLARALASYAHSHEGGSTSYMIDFLRPTSAD